MTRSGAAIADQPTTISICSFQAAKIFMQMESDPAPSVGVLRPSSARAPQTAGQRLSERIAERLAGKLDEDALLADIHSHATAYRPAAPTTQDDT